MPQAQKYYWLKLKNDFFDDDVISWLEEQEHGSEYVLFYLKLCLKSLKTDGILIRNVGEMIVPYDAKRLSEITRTKFDTVVVAMELLKKIGLIEVLDCGELYLTQVNQMTGSETTKAAIMRRSREKKKLESAETPCISDDGNNVTQLLPENSKNVDTEIRDKSLEIRDKNNKTSSKSMNVNYQQIVDMYHSICKSYPVLRSISESRKKAIRARARVYPIEAFQQVFENAEASSFLKGSNNRDWSADFDWMMKDKNFTKILEGNYGGISHGTGRESPETYAGEVVI